MKKKIKGKVIIMREKNDTYRGEYIIYNVIYIIYILYINNIYIIYI
jgi:hypothetical protein